MGYSIWKVRQLVDGALLRLADLHDSVGGSLISLVKQHLLQATEIFIRILIDFLNLAIMGFSAPGVDMRQLQVLHVADLPIEVPISLHENSLAEVPNVLFQY